MGGATDQIPFGWQINSDMGEAFGRWQLGPDEELMKYIDVANVACGFHASDPVTLHKSECRLAP